MFIKKTNPILLTVFGCINCALSRADTCSSLLEVVHENSSLSFAETVFNTSSGQIQWCSSDNMVYEDGEYWLEFDLKEVHIITAFEIHTVHKNNKSEFPKPLIFSLNYTRPVLKDWINKWNVLMTLTGNKYSLKHSIWANQIRVVPILDTPICLTVQWYGCLWSEGLVSYTMPPNDIGEKDYYDGELENDLLKNGLGQLVDGLNRTSEGEDRVKRWVGWHDSTKMNSVELVFEFDDVRIFESVQLAVENNPYKEVEVFKIAEVTFSTEGQNYSYPPICYHHFLNDHTTGAQTITLDLNSHKGKFAKLNLYFKSKWIYLSEVKFKNHTNTFLALLLFHGTCVSFVLVTLAVLLVLLTIVVICRNGLKNLIAALLLKKKSKLRDEHYNDDGYLRPKEDQDTLDPMYETLEECNVKQKHEACYNELRQLVIDKLTQNG